MIASYCRDKGKKNIRYNAVIDPSEGITASDFLDWAENGFGAGEIVLMDDEPAIIGMTHFKAPTIVAKLSDDKILIQASKIPRNRLKRANLDIVDGFMSKLFANGLQFNWKMLKLTQRYIPSHNEKIIFHGKNIKGLGIVRSINSITGVVSLYCYYTYETRQCGYSMNETGIVNLKDFIFEPMMNDDFRITELDGRSCYHRLQTELGKLGKVWNDRLLRIEPKNLQVPIGEKYWYISDKMSLVQDVEKGRQTSRDRANAGNYFWTRKEAEEILLAWIDELRGRLAQPGLNKIQEG